MNSVSKNRSKRSPLLLMAGGLSIVSLCVASPHRISTSGSVKPPPIQKPSGSPNTATSPLEIKVFPASLVFEKGQETRRIVVLGRPPGGDWLDITAAAQVRSATGIVKGDREGNLHPLKAGAGSLTVLAGGGQAEIPVAVKSIAQPPVSFVRDVMPILSRVGCNAGTCHGGQKGKGGFKLSLRGYDPDWDYNVLTTEMSGRRINRSDPSQSLILLKPTQGVPHKGGLVLDPGSDYYATLLRWIEEGIKNDAATTRRPDRLEALPASPTLKGPGSKQRLLVIAHYPDGATRDVTHDAVYSSGTPDVATVSPDGEVTALRRGEAPMLIRYEGAYASDPLTVMGDRNGWKWVEEPARNRIDALIYDKLRRVKSLPSPLCTDAEFIRRVSIDLTGIPPEPEQVRAFLSDPTPSERKRDRLIDELMDSPAFVDDWSNRWADLLEVNRKFLGERGVWVFRNWIHRAVAENRPYDRFVREILTASGDSLQNPPANYFRVIRDSSVATENATQLFMGVRFSCNKCHDHPFERWTQNQYYQMAAFFAQVGTKPGDGPDEEVVYDNPDGGQVVHPKTGKTVAPKFPIGDLKAHAGPVSRREMLAEWLTSPQNPFFAKAMANRIWSYFFGKGIIEPVDDIRAGNPPTNPELLDYLTTQFTRSGFNTKALMRLIVQSRAYQRSIRTNRWNDTDTINFSHAIPRRLMAEPLMDAVRVATGSTSKYPGLPEGFHATQLPDNGVSDGGFLDLFGRPPRESPCECERVSTISLAQALNLINGPTIADALADPEGRLAKLVKTQPDPAKRIEAIYLAALSRPPQPAEMAKALPLMKTAESDVDAAQDLMWALLNSPAFLFNR